VEFKKPKEKDKRRERERKERGQKKKRARGITYAINIQLSVSSDVKEPAGGIVGARDKGVAVGEELDGIDVGLVAGKGLDGLPGADVPELGESIAGTRDESVLICGIEADAHDIAQMVGKLDHLGSRLDIPLHACHVARRCQDTPVIDESAAREVAGMARELSRDACGPVPVLVEIVDGADVVETTAGHVVAAGGVGARHDPRGTERDGVHLVGGVGIPDDQLSILRRRHEVSPVGGPVHGIDLCEMALQCPLGFHQLVLGDGLVGLLGHSSDCSSDGQVSTADRLAGPAGPSIGID